MTRAIRAHLPARPFELATLRSTTCAVTVRAAGRHRGNVPSLCGAVLTFEGPMLWCARSTSIAHVNPDMQRTVLAFRVLILAGLALGLVGSTIDFLVPSLVPSTLDDAWDSYVADESWGSTVVIGSLASLVFVAGVVATIGLLLLKRWARPLALAVTVLSLLTYPLLGPTVSSGWAQMISESGMIMWGAALSMTFFAELKSHFE
jgi:hypothetical protein